MTDAAPLAGLAPDTPQAHAGLKAARELIRRGECAVALDVLSGPECRDTPLAQLLRADLLLGGNRPEPALALYSAFSRPAADTYLARYEQALREVQAEISYEQFFTTRLAP